MWRIGRVLSHRIVISHRASLLTNEDPLSFRHRSHATRGVPKRVRDRTGRWRKSSRGWARLAWTAPWRTRTPDVFIGVGALGVGRCGATRSRTLYLLNGIEELDAAGVELRGLEPRTFPIPSGRSASAQSQDSFHIARVLPGLNLRFPPPGLGQCIEGFSVDEAPRSGIPGRLRHPSVMLSETPSDIVGAADIVPPAFGTSQDVDKGHNVLELQVWSCGDSNPVPSRLDRDALGVCQVRARVYCTANFSLGGPDIRGAGRKTPAQATRSSGPPGLEASPCPTATATPHPSPRAGGQDLQSRARDASKYNLCVAAAISASGCAVRNDTAASFTSCIASTHCLMSSQK